MKDQRAFLILILVIIAVFPMIPTYRRGGAIPYGERGLMVGFDGECGGLIPVSLLYLFTGVGPNIVLKAPPPCF